MAQRLPLHPLLTDKADVAIPPSPGSKCGLFQRFDAWPSGVWLAFLGRPAFAPRGREVPKLRRKWLRFKAPMKPKPKIIASHDAGSGTASDITRLSKYGVICASGEKLKKPVPAPGFCQLTGTATQATAPGGQYTVSLSAAEAISLC